MALREPDRCRGADLEGTADPGTEGGRGAGGDTRRESEFPGPPDRPEQVPDEAAAAVRAGLRVRRRDRGGRRWREGPEGRRCGGRVRWYRRVRYARLRRRRTRDAA